MYLPTPSPLTTVLPWVSPSSTNSVNETIGSSVTSNSNNDLGEIRDPIRYGVLTESKDVYAFHDGERHFCGPVSEIVLSPPETESMNNWRLSAWDFINYPGSRPERSAACDPDKANKMT